MSKKKTTKNDRNSIEDIDPSSLDDLTGFLVKQGIIIVDDDIHEETVKNVYRQLLYIHHSEYNKEVQLVINSPGGYLHLGFGLLDVLDYIRNPIRTIATGQICSMAALLFIAGDHRVMSEQSIAMFHHFSDSEHGSYPALLAKRKGDDLSYKIMLKHIVRNSKYNTEEEVLNNILKDHDNYLSAQEMMDHGMCEEIIPARTKTRNVSGLTKKS